MDRIFTQTFGVGGAIIEHRGKFLLVREGKHGLPDDGKWSHPAGWIDVGENPISATKREVEEETGYQFTVTHLLGIYSIVRKDIAEQMGNTPHAIKIIVTGTIAGEQQSLHSDVTETKWFTAEEIEAMDANTLRDLDIKQMVRHYLSGRRYPLDLITHTLTT